jgi:hypothetical protein
MGRLTTLAGGTTRIASVAAIESATSIRFGRRLDVALFRSGLSFAFLGDLASKGLVLRGLVDGDNLYLWGVINGTIVGGSTPGSLASLPANGTDVVFSAMYTTGSLTIQVGLPGGSPIFDQTTAGGTALVTGASTGQVNIAGSVAQDIDAAWVATDTVVGAPALALPTPAACVHLCWCVDISNVGTSGQALTLGDGTLTGTGGDWNGSPPPPPSLSIARRRMAARSSLV